MEHLPNYGWENEEDENWDCWQESAYPPEYIEAQLADAFDKLRKHGVDMRHNFYCCQSCANSALYNERQAATDEARKEWIGCGFYHEQDTEHAAIKGELYLSFSAYDPNIQEATTERVGEMIVEELTAAGLVVEWDGSEWTRILVKLDS